MEISEKDYLAVVGLLELAEQTMERSDRIAETLAEILGVEETMGGYYGHVLDAVGCGYDADTLLSKLDITVEDSKEERTQISYDSEVSIKFSLAPHSDVDDEKFVRTLTHILASRAERLNLDIFEITVE